MPAFIPDDPALQAVLAIMAGAGGLKVWLRMKGDVRDDGIGAANKKAHEDIAGTYSKLVLDLQQEVARLATAVAAMSHDLDVERMARYNAETLAAGAERTAAALAIRVNHLEHVLKKNGIDF